MTLKYLQQKLSLAVFVQQLPLPVTFPPVLQLLQLSLPACNNSISNSRESSNCSSNADRDEGYSSCSRNSSGSLCILPGATSTAATTATTATVAAAASKITAFQFRDISVAAFACVCRGPPYVSPAATAATAAAAHQLSLLLPVLPLGPSVAAAQKPLQIRGVSSRYSHDLGFWVLV